MSFPPATEMFQFAGFASRSLCIQLRDTYEPNYLIAGRSHRTDNRDKWVSPFGNLRVKGCSHLTAAYRSVPRPSSPVHAKASTNCPYLTLESPHHQRQRWAGPKAGQLGRAASRGISVWMISISARFVIGIGLHKPPPAGADRVVQTNAATASILRTHSQCQRGPSRPNTPRKREDLVSSSSGNLIENVQPARRQSRQSRAPPRLPRLAFQPCALVEPIGIEPMT